MAYFLIILATLLILCSAAIVPINRTGPLTVRALARIVLTVICVAAAIWLFQISQIMTMAEWIQ